MQTKLIQLSSTAFASIFFFCSPLSAQELGEEKANSCAAPIACNTQLPNLGAPEGFLHAASIAASKAGAPRHRAQDVFVQQGRPIEIAGKFAYGLADKDLEGEGVDILISPACQSDWKQIGRAFTTGDKDSSAVDAGGRISYQIDAGTAALLAPGRYRVLLLVAGDHSQTELILDVLAPQAAIVVSDVDGTLTTKETSGVDAALGLTKPQANAGAPELMQAFAARGYQILYLTARPEWLQNRTKSWLKERGFPEGHVQTSLSLIGLSGSAAVSYKTKVLEELEASTGLVPAYAFGNTETDARAYVNAGIAGETSYFYRYPGDTFGGQRFDDYRKLLSIAQEAPSVCAID